MTLDRCVLLESVLSEHGSGKRCSRHWPCATSGCCGGAGLISGLGSWLLVVAAPAHVLATTDSLLATGLVLAAEWLPFVALGPLAGVLADRLDRRVLLIVLDVIRAAAIAMLFLADSAPWIVHVAMLVESAATVVALPAMQALVPAVVGSGRLLSSANALLAVSSGVGRLVGGPLGAALFVAFGFEVVVGADVATYVVSAVAIALTLRRRRPPGEVPPADVAVDRPTFRAGVVVLRRHRVVAALVPATAVFLLANAMLSALLVPIGVQRLGGPNAVGVVLSALGVGYLAGAPLLRVLVDRLAIRPLLAGAQAVTAAGFALLVHAGSAPVAVGAALLIGASGSIVLGAPRTVVQRTIPGSALGRVGAVFGMTEAAATLVGAVAGPAIAALAGIPVAGFAAVVLAAAAAALTVVVVPPGDGSLPSTPPGAGPEESPRAESPDAGSTESPHVGSVGSTESSTGTVGGSR